MPPCRSCRVRGGLSNRPTLRCKGVPRMQSRPARQGRRRHPGSISISFVRIYATSSSVKSSHCRQTPPGSCATPFANAMDLPSPAAGPISRRFPTAVETTTPIPACPPERRVDFDSQARPRVSSSPRQLTFENTACDGKALFSNWQPGCGPERKATELESLIGVSHSEKGRERIRRQSGHPDTPGAGMAAHTFSVPGTPGILALVPERSQGHPLPSAPAGRGPPGLTASTHRRPPDGIAHSETKDWSHSDLQDKGPRPMGSSKLPLHIWRGFFGSAAAISGEVDGNLSLWWRRSSAPTSWTDLGERV